MPASFSSTLLHSNQSYPFRIAVGDDGNIYASETIANRIAVTSPNGTLLSEIQLPAGTCPLGLASRSGFFQMFFTTSTGLGVLNLADNSTQFFALPTGHIPSGGIVVGPDNAIYISEYSNIARLDPELGIFSFYTLPSTNGVPSRLTVGADDNIWYTGFNSNVVGKLNPITSAVVEYALPTYYSMPLGITSGPDGNIWYVALGGDSGNIVGKVTLEGVVTEYHTPTEWSQPQEITVGPDGNLWVVELGIGLAQVTTSGEITEYPTPSGLAPFDVVASPDGSGLFFTVNYHKKIGKLTLDLPLALTNPGDQADAEGGAVSVGLFASAGTGVPYLYSAVGLPTGLAIDSQTGEISGTIDFGTVTGSSQIFSVTVTASDGAHNTSQSFN